MNRVLVTGAAGALGRAVVADLTAHGIATIGLDRVPGTDVQGDVDRETVERLIAGVDGVVHLAAIPAPGLVPDEVTFGGNSLATFIVLDAAGRTGVPRAVIASSLSILGLAFAPRPTAPQYLPIDEGHPLRVADPYALGKQADEATGVAMHHRYGLTGFAIRFPRLGDPDGRLAYAARRWRDDPADGARELWAYLDYRDAARAVRLALLAEADGFATVQVAAPETLAAQPTEVLLDRYLPGVPRRGPVPGYAAAYDLTRARDMLGFEAEHLYEPVREGGC